MNIILAISLSCIIVGLAMGYFSKSIEAEALNRLKMSLAREIMDLGYNNTHLEAKLNAALRTIRRLEGELK